MIERPHQDGRSSEPGGRGRRPIEALLFDFGGVMVGSPFKAMSAAGAGGGHGPDEVLEALLGDYGADTDHPFHRLERGEIRLDEYATWATAHLDQRQMTVDLGLMADLYRGLGVHDDMVDTVRRLRREGYRTALVTNNVRELGVAWRALMPLDQLFDVVVDSCEVGMRKPNPAIYLHTLEQLGGLAPELAVLLDDAPGNVAGAKVAGLHAILVEDPAAALVELAALLAG